MEKYIGTYHKSSPFIQNLLKKQICSFEISWQNSPPGLQIFQNLPLDSYSHVLAEIHPPPPPVCRFSQICHCTVTYTCLQKSPQFPDFPEISHWTVTYMCLFVPVWEIYSAILLLCSCLYLIQWRTTMNYPTWRHHVNSLKIQQGISCLQTNKQQIEQRIKDKKEQYEDNAARNL